MLYCEHVLLAKRRSCFPSSFVCDRSDRMVYSVCFRSFAYACHVARSKARSRIILLCGSGSSPSRTGIQHYRGIQSLPWRWDWQRDSLELYPQNPLPSSSSLRKHSHQTFGLCHGQMSGLAESCVLSEWKQFRYTREYQPCIKLLDHSHRQEQPENVEGDSLADTKLEVVHQVNSHQWAWINTELSKVCILQARHQPTDQKTRTETTIPEWGPTSPSLADQTPLCS